MCSCDENHKWIHNIVLCMREIVSWIIIWSLRHGLLGLHLNLRMLFFTNCFNTILLITPTLIVYPISQRCASNHVMCIIGMTNHCSLRSGAQWVCQHYSKDKWIKSFTLSLKESTLTMFWKGKYTHKSWTTNKGFRCNKLQM